MPLFLFTKIVLIIKIELITGGKIYRTDNIKYKCLDLIYISNNIKKNKTLVYKSNAYKHFYGK